MGIEDFYVTFIKPSFMQYLCIGGLTGGAGAMYGATFLWDIVPEEWRYLLIGVNPTSFDPNAAYTK